MNVAILLICSCVVCVVLSIFIAFQMSKEHKRQQFLLILTRSKFLLAIFIFTGIIISLLLYLFFGMVSAPIILVTMLLSLNIPILISTFRYSLGKK